MDRQPFTEIYTDFPVTLTRFIGKKTKQKSRESKREKHKKAQKERSGDIREKRRKWSKQEKSHLNCGRRYLNQCKGNEPRIRRNTIYICRAS
jgi:hypothetical protein